jgi:hybrid cluster-associated redox disulfide protein
MKKITKDMTLDEVLELEPRLVAVMLGFGLHCFGCPVSSFETLEEAAVVHDLELDLFLDELNNMLEEFEGEQ